MADVDDVANALFDSLLLGADFSIPEVDLSGPEYDVPSAGSLADPIDRLTNDDLTTKVVTGTGTFDVLMQALRCHLQKEFEANRITGQEYAKTYVALTEGAMAQAVAFLIQRDSSYWQAVTAQQQALAAQAAVVTARVQLEAAKVQLQGLRAEAATNQANYALTKMKLATEKATFDSTTYQIENMLPAQLTMVREQMESARAQTMNTRSDGVTDITGVLGKQKDLYTQQITSYQRDAEVKAAKIFSDAWITMKTIDEGLLPPDNFNNASLNTILASLKSNNELS